MRLKHFLETMAEITDWRIAQGNFGAFYSHEVSAAAR